MMREYVWTHRVLHESESLLCWKQTVGWELHQVHGAWHRAEPHKQPNTEHGTSAFMAERVNCGPPLQEIL